MWDNLKADTRRLREIKTKGAPWYVIESLLFETGYQAVVLHRIAHWFKSRGVPVLGPMTARCNQFLTGVDIAREMVQKLGTDVQGIQLSAPFGKVELALAIIS